MYKAHKNRKHRPYQKPVDQDPVAYAEIEGDRWYWYYVCSECHGMIVDGQKKCMNCNRRIIWNGTHL